MLVAFPVGRSDDASVIFNRLVSVNIDVAAGLGGCVDGCFFRLPVPQVRVHDFLDQVHDEKAEN